mgnify:CR=1 FL=1
MVYLLKKNYKINNIYKSPIKHKKYRVVLIHKRSGKVKHMDFGSVFFQQFKDKTPVKLYKHLDHGDNNRRRLYKKRHQIHIRTGYYSPGYFSMRYLW